MQLTINDEIREIADNTSLLQLANLLSLPKTGVAIAVNQRVVSRDTWQTFQLKEGDSVFIIRPTQGG